MRKIEYVSEHYQVIFGRPLHAEKAQIKWYTLWPTHNTLPTQAIQTETREIALTKIDHFIPNAHAGVGCAIHSPDILNIVLWDAEEPIIVHPHIYELERKGLRQTIRQADITKVGPFCIEEVLLLTKEWPFWEAFLHSSQQKVDLARYLTQGFEGNLS